MERKFKHKKTGWIATQSESNKYLYQYDTGMSVHYNIHSSLLEKSCDWEEIEKYTVGTKVKDTFTEYTYEKTESGKWKLETQDYFDIADSSIGEGKRFRLFEKEPIFTTFDGVELFGGEEVYIIMRDFRILGGIFTVNGNPTNKIFAEKTKAEEYIRLNEPKYSFKDVEDAMSGFPGIVVKDIVLTFLAANKN